MRPYVLGLTILGACSGGTSDVSTAPKSPGSAVDAALLGQTWQVRLAVDAARAPFEGRASWTAWFEGRRLDALRAFASEGDAVGLARAHAEYSAIYREAARMAANATLQVYGADAQPTDPKDTAYLLGVSGALLGDSSTRSKLGSSSESPVSTLAAQDKAWKAWVDAGAAWPPDAPAGTGPGAVASLGAGESPGAGAVPHYLLPEQGVDTKVDAGDPGTLWALARAHEAAAVAASGESQAAVRVWVDPWRLPPEPREASAGASIPDTFLFMSPYTSAGDVLFLSDLEREGVAAVAAHTGDSAYAVVIGKCTKDAGIDVDCILDEGAALGQAIESAMATAAGREDSFHRPFADFARAGLLRAADRVAWKMGDTENAGRLRILALDRSVDRARDPLFILSVAAWDAGNRNSVRAEELVHGLLTEVPGLEAARLPLDALHIRLSRNAAPGRPMH